METHAAKAKFHIEQTMSKFPKYLGIAILNKCNKMMKCKSQTHTLFFRP